MTFGLITAWYRWRARRIGIRIEWRWFVGTGVGALLAMAVIAAVPVELPRDIPLGTISAQPPPLGAILLNGLLTTLLPIGLAIVALGIAEGSRALASAGGWVAVIAWLQCTWGITSIPAWIGQLLGNGDGASDTGRYNTLPGPLLITMALPLAEFAAVRGWQARGTSSV